MYPTGQVAGWLWSERATVVALPEPPKATASVTAPDAPPPVNPAPAVTSVMSAAGAAAQLTLPLGWTPVAYWPAGHARVVPTGR